MVRHRLLQPMHLPRLSPRYLHCLLKAVKIASFLLLLISEESPEILAASLPTLSLGHLQTLMIVVKASFPAFFLPSLAVAASTRPVDLSDWKLSGSMGLFDQPGPYTPVLNHLTRSVQDAVLVCSRCCHDFCSSHLFHNWYSFLRNEVGISHHQTISTLTTPEISQAVAHCHGIESFIHKRILRLQYLISLMRYLGFRALNPQSASFKYLGLIFHEPVRMSYALQRLAHNAVGACARLRAK